MEAANTADLFSEADDNNSKVAVHVYFVRVPSGDVLSMCWFEKRQ